MKNYKAIFFIFAFLLLSFQSVKSQKLLTPDELENLLLKAEKQSQNYGKVFQNLSAEELKTKFYYKQDGKLDEKRTIKSVFVVYQSPNGSSEFRNVLEFNGKNVSRDEKETAKFFEKLAKVGTSAEEYQKISKEGLRYDGKRVSWGMTLYQPRPFSENLKSAFDFRVVGKEKIEGRDVWIVEYEQTKASPYILSNPTKEKEQSPNAVQYNMPISDAFRPTNPRLKGKLWLDAETGQIWRNAFRIILNPKNLSVPIEATEISYEYQPSDFGILTPKKFLIRSVNIRGKSEKDLSVTKDAETVYEYSKFSEFKTETKNYEIKSN